ncbi:MAG: amidohydrolase family protein [Acidimicrobiia bacterium]
MHARVQLNSPFGDRTILDIRRSMWSLPEGEPELTLGQGMWAVPGLVDAHAHLAKDRMDFLPGDLDGAVERSRMALESGVMLALDKGWRDLTVVDLIDVVAEIERPDIETAGVMHASPGGYYDGFARIISSGQMEESVRMAAGESRGWVKLVGDWPRKGIGPQPNFSEEELSTAVVAAESVGARVALHTMAPDVPSMAVRAGVHSIEHGLFLTEGDLAAFGGRGGLLVPTIVQVEAIVAQLGAESSGGRLLLAGLENLVRLLPDALEAGVKVLTGTDLAVGSHDVAKEAVRLWEMGMSSTQVLSAVSHDGLEATGRPSVFAPDTYANAVFFKANPLDDPAVLRFPELVVRHGRIVT